MYLEYFCLSPSHSMRFPVTAIIKSANFSGIIFFVRFVQILYKKMKKSVAPLSLKGLVQGARKCIPQGFVRLFGLLKISSTEKSFLIFSRKIYYTHPNLCNRAKKGLLNIPLKTASFQRLYFTFNFKIRNVTYMLLQHICYIFIFLLLQPKNRSLFWLRFALYLIVY